MSDVQAVKFWMTEIQRALDLTFSLFTKRVCNNTQDTSAASDDIAMVYENEKEVSFKIIIRRSMPLQPEEMSVWCFILHCLQNNHMYNLFL
jgi:hypothetical protein